MRSASRARAPFSPALIARGRMMMMMMRLLPARTFTAYFSMLIAPAFPARARDLHF